MNGLNQSMQSPGWCQQGATLSPFQLFLLVLSRNFSKLSVIQYAINKTDQKSIWLSHWPGYCLGKVSPQKMEPLVHEMTVNEQLREIVSHYLENHQNLSLNGFASRSNTSATTLRRILSAVTKTEPAPHTILNLVSYIYREKNISKLLQLVPGPVGDRLRKSFSQYVFAGTEHTIDSNLNEILRDANAYLIYKLAANRKGTTKIEIFDLLGQVGLEKMLTLKKFAVIKEDENGTIHAKNKNFSLDISIAKDHLPHLISFYKTDEVEEGKNLFYSLSESLNQEAIDKIKKIKIEAIKRVHEIMEAENSQGDTPYFSVFLSDTLTLKHPAGALQ